MKLTRREKLAIAAMRSIIINPDVLPNRGVHIHPTPHRIAEYSIAIADAIIRQLES